jgi:hypothetical protein
MCLRLSRRRSILPALLHRSTLHTRARGAQRVVVTFTWVGNSVSRHTHTQLMATLPRPVLQSMRELLWPYASIPPLALGENSSPPGHSSRGGCAIQLIKSASAACHTIHRSLSSCAITDRRRSCSHPGCKRKRKLTCEMINKQQHSMVYATHFTACSHRWSCAVHHRAFV